MTIREQSSTHRLEFVPRWQPTIPAHWRAALEMRPTFSSLAVIDQASACSTVTDNDVLARL